MEHLDSVTMAIYSIQFMLMFAKLLQELYTVWCAKECSTYSCNLLLYNTL